MYDYTGERTPDQYIKTTKEIILFLGHTYTKNTRAFTQAVEQLVLNDPSVPTMPDPTNATEFEIWKTDIKEYCTKKQEYDNFCTGFCNIIMGQCTEAMQDQLKLHKHFLASQQDGIALLAIIRALIHTFEEQWKLSDALCDVKETFYQFRQGNHMSLQQYCEQFVGYIEVLDEVGVSIADKAWSKM